MFAAFAIMRQLHELLWYVTEALTLPAAHPLEAELAFTRDELEQLTMSAAADLLAVDVSAQQQSTNALLLRSSEYARAELPGPGADRRGADLVGADLAGVDLRAASLRGALLVAADLRGADLRGADLTGADLRGADIRGADLTGSIFLVQAQLDAAKGDANTRFSPPFSRPAHWAASAR